jgi:hypothetical protein
MSEYDRFTNWVKQKRQCPDDDLESTINSISIQYIRSIMKGVEEAAGRPRPPNKIPVPQKYPSVGSVFTDPKKQLSNYREEAQ